MPIVADEDRFRQSLFNAIRHTNAVKK